MEKLLAPHCIGFIMDGNRRFAKERGEATLLGHQAGEAKFYEVAQWVKNIGISHAVFYAFSTENWLREKVEVTYLQDLFLSFTKRMTTEVTTWQVRVRVFGNLASFSDELQTAIAELEAVSAKYTATTIWVALSYGGRAEIIQATNQAIKNGVLVDETSFTKLLFTSDMPDPDLIIRTGGQQRLSNFLPWQSIYSELFFTPTYWPAFTNDEFTRILAQYGERQRRHGI